MYTGHLIHYDLPGNPPAQGGRVLDVLTGVIAYCHFNAGSCNGIKDSALAHFLSLTKNIEPVTLHIACTSS